MAWGSLHKTEAAKVGELARAAISFCSSMGGSVPSTNVLNRIGSIGASGRYDQNAERDLQRLMSKVALECEIETVRVRVNDPARGVIVHKDFPIVYPDTMAAALWAKGEGAFRHFFFGSTNARKYWQHCSRHSTWFQDHPASVYEKKSHLIPLSLYGDEVQTYRNSECGVVEVFGFSSDFASQQGPMSRYLPILVISEHHVCPHTWDDIWTSLIPRLHALVTRRDWPWSGSNYHFMMSSLQGDLKWIVAKFGVNNYQRNEICSLCSCCKSHADPGMTIGNFRLDASHRATLVTHARPRADPWFIKEILFLCLDRTC